MHILTDGKWVLTNGKWQQTGRSSDGEGDALLQNGESMSTSMAAELDAYLSQVVCLLVLCSALPA